jgi:hypothetical protein
MRGGGQENRFLRNFSIYGVAENRLLVIKSILCLMTTWHDWQAGESLEKFKKGGR